MPLVVSAKVGHVIDVGSIWITVWSIENKHSATIRTGDGRLEKLSSNGFRKISPNVEIRLGIAPTTGSWLKLHFRAPRAIHIGRRKIRSY